MAILRPWTRTEVNAIQPPGLLGILGLGISKCLDIAAKGILTVVIIINPFLGNTTLSKAPLR